MTRRPKGPRASGPGESPTPDLVEAEISPPHVDIENRKAVMANDKEVRETIDTLDLSNFVDESLSNPPWWAPEIRCNLCEGGEGRTLGQEEFLCKKHPDATLVGNKFYGTVLTKEAPLNSNDFSRYVLQAQTEHVMQLGSKDSGELVTVNPGDFFTVSEYGGLPLDRYYGVTVIILTVGKVRFFSKTQGRHVPLWKFGLKVDAATKKLLEKDRQDLGKLAAQVQRDKKLQYIGRDRAPVAALPAKKTGTDDEG